MASSVEYRRNAELCLRLMEYGGSPEAKAFLLTMAGAWHRLAQDIENFEQCAEAAARVAEKGRAEG